MAGWCFWIDRGGTFTDIVARDPAGRLSTRKLLSETGRGIGDEAGGEDAAIAGIRASLGLAAGVPVPAGAIDSVRMGTTVATNALLERRGARVLLVVGRGFGDSLRIGNQARPRLFDLDIRLPAPLYERAAEIGGRMGADGCEVEPLDEAGACEVFASALRDGLQACAIVLMHAWRYPAHERRLAALAREAGFSQVSVSHEVSPLPRLVPRGQTTVLDAYLSPVLRRHVSRVSAALPGVACLFMQSNGGLADAAAFTGKDAILSGPAGGIVGAARTAQAAGIGRIIGFDMGGTSTDVALYDGAFERRFETELAGLHITAPMMAIHTVAAGGGSVLHAQGGRFRVGPDSAGARPGPACYRQGGPLTVTDANVMLGRIQPAFFPAIFGPEGRERLDAAIVEAGFAALVRGQDPRVTAAGFLRIAVANMAAAIKQVSLARGVDHRAFTLQCFGGAGGQHACLVADELGMRRVFIHRFAGVLSAYGMGLAEPAVLREQAMEATLTDDMAPLEALAGSLAGQAHASLAAQGVSGGIVRASVHLRYEGTQTALMLPLRAGLREAFTRAHRTRFGFATPARALVVEAVSVEVSVPGEAVIEKLARVRDRGGATPIETVRMWSGGMAHRAPVFDRDGLCAGDRLPGPALICEADATTVVEVGWQATVSPHGHLLLEREGDAAPGAHGMEAGAQKVGDAAARPDPVLLEMFDNLFVSVAEQAGIVLAATAVSVNIRERLDFSCAIFDAAGRLVANAPHVPVHLGAMGESVRTVLRRRGRGLRPGDVVALNNPFDGGTHLPDVTVITPVFDEAGAEIMFFAASRGHHADIGGITPGSTPPSSTSLEQEGVVIDDFLLVSQGEFREAAFRDLLAGARYPARSPDVNVADIGAQIAANACAARELSGVVARYGWPMVAAYMRHVMDHAAESVRRVLRDLADGAFTYTMEDGARLQVRVTVDRVRGAATIDFTGTGPQHAGNFNAPPAVTRAVVLYCFRCLAGTEIALNEGCLEPLTIVIPRGSFLSPAPGAAVVAGNTEVSQAVCAALLGALGAAASSQATMNNFLFGDGTYQYYETICGGAGAGPGFAGASAVQTNMTNTRMTDPEVLERRYPVRVEAFCVREGSGGPGRFPGGDGVIRRVKFLKPMQLVIVASRRREGPFGQAGGGPGMTGSARIERADGQTAILASADSAEMHQGDTIIIETPGGGAWGAPTPAP